MYDDDDDEEEVGLETLKELSELQETAIGLLKQYIENQREIVRLKTYVRSAN
jgi:hypothetical protein